jgi:predicted nuclease of predicted toxin-antitoxin system
MSEVREPPPRPTGPGRLTVWVDAHISPSIAAWLGGRYGVDARSVTRLGLPAAADHALFRAAKAAEVDALLTKDDDFERIVRSLGVPPSIVLVTCGNARNAELRAVLEAHFERVLSHVRRGEPVIEVGRVG